MSLKLKCFDVKLEKSKIPHIYLLNAICDNVILKMDVHEELNIFENKHEIMLEILTNKPSCSANELCGYGYVFSKRNINGKTIILISLGGFIIRLEGSNKALDELPLMEKMYIRITPLS